MAENPMTNKEFKRLRQFIKPFSRLNTLLYKLSARLIREPVPFELKEGSVHEHPMVSEVVLEEVL